MRIGIAAGDVTGIGPEVALKALKAEAERGDLDFLVIGDAPRLQRLNQDLGLNLPLQVSRDGQERGRFLIHDPLAEPLPAALAPGAPAAARAALDFLRDGAKR